MMKSEFVYPPIKSIAFEKGGYSMDYQYYSYEFTEKNVIYKRSEIQNGKHIEKIKDIPSENARKILEDFQKIHVELWKDEYVNHEILDGEQWELTIDYGYRLRMITVGSNDYPENYEMILDFFEIED